MHVEKLIGQYCKAYKVERQETLQTLWSGYGEIVRYKLFQQDGSSCAIPFVIAKSINPPANESQSQHPRGWNTQTSHLRKLTSYAVESQWYSHWASRCQAPFTVAQCYASLREGQQQLIILSDLDALGYDKRYHQLSSKKSKACLKWLAHFHAFFMVDTHNTPTTWPQGLWPTGCYWHLSTRQDEWKNMPDSKLKSHAKTIDKTLNNSQYQTLVHGDAKVANFCFNDVNNTVAAVDFQYVGAGCGVKDIAYFIGSCLTETDCYKHYVHLVDYYFSELRQALLAQKTTDAEAVEKQWRYLLPFAWADFQRFIIGWMPTHAKNNGFSQAMSDKALQQLS